MSRPTFRTDIRVAPLSAEQAAGEAFDRVRRLKANGLAEFSDPAPTTFSTAISAYPWLSLLAVGVLPYVLPYLLARKAGRGE